jgi:glycosyltransferase involved in cell wall biosynthesis
MLKVSVIIPTYNCENYICETIDSVFAQTYQDFEIIVVDDGSTDNTKEVLKKYSDRIRYFFQEKSGPSVARNAGVRASLGEYLAFLDSDDIWLRNKLEIQIKIMDSSPEVGLICTDGEKFNNEGMLATSLRPSLAKHALFKKDSLKFRISQTEINDGSIFKGDLYKELCLGNVVVTSSVLVRSSCLRKIGDFDKGLNVAEDYDLWIRISQKYQILYLNRVTVRYRIRRDSISGELSLRNSNTERGTGLFFDKHLKVCPKEYRSVIRRRAYECYRDAAWGYFHHGEMKEARRLCYRSLVYNWLQPKLYLYFLGSFFPTKALNFIRKFKYSLQERARSV